MELISRQQAKILGLKTYFTGKSCIRGHISERYTQDCSCIACSKEFIESNKEKRKINKELAEKKQNQEEEDYLGISPIEIPTDTESLLEEYRDPNTPISNYGISALQELYKNQPLAIGVGGGLGAGLGAGLGQIIGEKPLVGGLMGAGLGAGLGALTPTLMDKYLQPYLEDKLSEKYGKSIPNQ